MISIRNLQKKIPISSQRIKRVILKTLTQEGAQKSGEISVALVTDKIIKRINRKYLGKNRPTDVMAFNLSESPQGKFLGEIIISTDTALSNSQKFNTRPQDEIYLYLIHGLLHLLGYDDNTRKNALKMQKRLEYLCQFIKPKL